MKKKKSLPATDYGQLLTEVKSRIQLRQTRAVVAANAELIRLYWDVGQILAGRQEEEGWGALIIPKLSRELRNELPELKGFSERNIKSMLAFFRAYPEADAIVQQPVAQLPSVADAGDSRPQAKVQQPVALSSGRRSSQTEVLWLVPWGHHLLLLQKLKELEIRVWYMEQVLQHGWSRNVLTLMINSEAHKRQGKLVSNFKLRLPSPQSDLAQQSLKDPYIFDFLTLTEPFKERELETGLLEHLQSFLIELGHGFAFVGRQYKVEIGDEDLYIDLLFYHLRLRCFIVIDLKRGKFKPEYAGKMNFYLNVVNDKLRHQNDAETIGLILCQDKDSVAAEYALRGVQNPIGVSDYQLTKALPQELQSSLPSIEDIEAELAGGHAPRTQTKNGGKTKQTKASTQKNKAVKKKGGKK